MEALYIRTIRRLERNAAGIILFLAVIISLFLRG